PVGGLDQVHRDKPPGLLPVPRLDDKVGDRLRGRVDDQAAHLAAVTIGAAGPGPDRELRLPGHSRLPSSCWTVARTYPASDRSLARIRRRSPSRDALASGLSLNLGDAMASCAR